MLIGRGAPLRLVNTLNEAPVPLPLASVFSGTAWAARRDRDHRPRRGNCRQRRPAATRALAQAFHRGQFQRHGIWTARICDQAQRASRGAGRQVRRHHDAQLIRQASPQQRPVNPAARRRPAGASAGPPAARLREGEGGPGSARRAGRENGFHQLRHHFASLQDGGDVRALAEYLGHADPAFTLGVYCHLMPGSPDRMRQAIDRAFSEYPDCPEIDPEGKAGL